MKEDALKKARSCRLLQALNSLFEQSEMMLEEDAMRFDAFLKDNDRKAHDALKKADQETKEKQEKVQLQRGFSSRDQLAMGGCSGAKSRSSTQRSAKSRTRSPSTRRRCTSNWLLLGFIVWRVCDCSCWLASSTRLSWRS